MCKAVRYHYTCGHMDKHRTSQCRGTYHRKRGALTTAACSADAYIDLHLPTPCGPCHLGAWTSAWKRKLDRAAAFLDHANRDGLPGKEAVAQAVRDLESEYGRRSWDMGKVFPGHMKGALKKVGKGTRGVGRSRLAEEVLPEEVVLREDTEIGFEDQEKEEFDPSTLTYENPLFAQDSSWLDEWLAEHPAETDADAEAKEAGEDAQAVVEETSGMPVWGSEERSVPASTNPEEEERDDEELTRQIQETMRAFWEVVENDAEETTLVERSSSRAPSDASHENEDEKETGNEDEWDSPPEESPEPPTQLPDRTPPTPAPWTDGTHDTYPFPPISPPSNSTTTTNSTFSKMRKDIASLKTKNADRYYQLYLEIARREIRDQVGDVIAFPVGVGRKGDC